MAGLSLRQAAEEAGTSKSTILRAIQSGRLSAQRTDNGGYAIEPSELFRVYEKKPSIAPQQTADRPVVQSATVRDPGAMDDIRLRNAQLEAELNSLRAVIELERKRADELRADRDRWASQAERLSLQAPATAGRSWWPFRRTG